ncbi:MAG TPA: glutathione S-transferase family protein [Myxococcota bacterium]
MTDKSSGSAAAGGGRKIALYGQSQTPFTEKVRRALLMKGLAFDLFEPSGPEDFKRWSPDTGLLPVLTIDGERTHDSTAILLRLDERFPNPPLLASEPKIALQQRQLEDWADESFLFYFLRWQRVKAQREAAEAAAPKRGGLARIAMLRRLFAWLRAGGTWERPETAIVRGMADRLDDLVNLLGTRPFFYAERPSMADLAVYSMLRSVEHGSMPDSAQLLNSRPGLVAYMRRVEAETGG